MAKVKLTPHKKRHLPINHDDPNQAWSKNLERVQTTNAAALPENGKEYIAQVLTDRFRKGI